MTSTGWLSTAQRKYLQSKQCNSIRNLLYFCCKDGTITTPPPASEASDLPEPPVCGFTGVENRVSSL
jgi:hypothetical protein